jgi:hypothetical protein
MWGFALQRVTADEFRQILRLVRRGLAHRPHFMKHHPDAGLRRLPCRLGSCEAATNNLYY